MKQNGKLTKRNLMAEELFWPAYDNMRVRYTYGDSITEAMDEALRDAYGITDAILDITNKGK